MSSAVSVTGLLLRWEEERERGRLLTPEELCRDCPELLPEVAAKIRRLKEINDQFRSAATVDSLAVSVHEPAPAASPIPSGADLCHYELLDRLGSGGMGVVYRARDRRLNREVAIKLLLEDHPADSAACARFIAEAQITGQLQHPGIPAVHELGTLPDGRPFLALKLVKGRTLAALLQDRADPSHERGHFLAIFEQICHTVGYAHAHRVLHRDLKPGNVMVGAFGEVQVMDWGLAKVLTRDGTPASANPENEPSETVAPATAIETPPQVKSGTRTGTVMGTPAFMAPEQAGGEVRRLDARSDVFGLGAILCQILTGRPPHQGNDGNAVRLKAVRGQLDDALSRLDACGAEPDLVTLCKRCLAFRQEDRPADGSAVAAEVARIRAAAEERARQAELERAEALVREAEQRKRRRVWLGLAASLVVGLIISTGLSLWANHSRQQAEAKEQEALNAAAAEAKAKETAEAREAETKAVLDFVENRVLAAARPKGQGGLGHDVSLRRALENALRFVEDRFTNQPLIEARLRLTLGTSFGYLGDGELARQQCQRSLDLRKAHLGPDHVETLMSMHNLANCYEVLGRLADALKLREETLALRKARLGPDHPHTLMSMNNLANSYAALGRPADALKLREETLALQKVKLGPDHPQTLLSINNLANSYTALGRPADALRLHQETFALRKTKLGSDHPDTLVSMHNLANSYAAFGRAADALKLREETLALRKTKLGSDHADTLLSMTVLANSYADLGRTADALKLREETLALWKAKFGPDHPDTLRSMHNLANSYVDAGRPADALKLYQEALALRKAKLGSDHPDTLRSLAGLADGYHACGRSADALELHQETLAIMKAKLGPHHSDTLRGMNNLAAVYLALGRHVDALKLIQETLALRKAKIGPDHPDTLRSIGNLASTYIALRQSEKAVLLLQEALNHWQKQATQPGNVQAQMFLASTHGQLGQAEEARQQFAAAVQAYSQALEHFDLDQAGKLQDAAFRDVHNNFRLRLAICRKAEEAMANLDYALQQPPAEVPGLLEARLRVLLNKKDRAGVAATAAAWQQLSKKDTEQCYAAAAAWSLASQRAADENDRGEAAATALALLRRALEAKKPAPAPLLLAWRIEQDPDFAPLRSHPAGAAFLKELYAAGPRN